jgi:hydroxymethylpyrimidine pyrophosphatase-like HAD family hydrolase
VSGYRIAAIDLDGTLFRADGSVSARTRESLRRATLAGILPVIVTARPPRRIRDYCELLALTGPAVCCNGAITYDPARHAVLETAAIPAVVARALVEQLRMAIPGSTLAWEHGLRFGCDQNFPLAELFGSDEGDAQPPPGEIAKLLVYHPELGLATLLAHTKDIIGDAATATQSGDVVEITAAGVDKAAGVARLAIRHGVKPADVVAFGDMPNDAPLLRWAGHGVAVENAHPEALSAADEVTASNERDGVAVVLERLTRQARLPTDLLAHYMGLSIGIRWS